MKISLRLLALVVLLACLSLFVPDQLWAAGRGVGGSRGGFGGGVSSHGGFGNHNTGFVPFFPFYGLGGLGYGGLGNGGLGYGGHGMTPGYGYPYSGYRGEVAYETSYYTMYVQHASSRNSTRPTGVSVNDLDTAQPAGSLTPGEPAIATVEVRVPDDAEVWFCGNSTTMTGDTRVFSSPPLEPGRSYRYDVKARWMKEGQPIEKTLSVQVTAGQRALANFMNQ